jgi:hypothetical protein
VDFVNKPDFDGFSLCIAVHIVKPHIMGFGQHFLIYLGPKKSDPFKSLGPCDKKGSSLGYIMANARYNGGRFGRSLIN